MTDTCEKHCEANAFKIVIRGLEGEIVRLKERLAQEKALQALHAENERLGLYRDAYIDKSAAIRIATALGWTPPRTWVGLTDEEIDALADLHGTVNWAVMSYAPFTRAIEAKLKEKNT